MGGRVLPWFKDRFPVYLAPMAGVTDSLFRGYCKQYGADVVVTEFVSAEGIFRKNSRTLEYLDFGESERPLGVQLFGADPEHLARAAQMVLEWKRPDFIDLNFGCPVNKVVARNGGSALLRDCPLLERVSRAVVRAVAPHPVTAKIRIGWDKSSINAVQTARILEDCGVQALAVHGRTKDQGYSGEADWEVIGAVVAAVGIPVVGNGDLASAQDVARRRRDSGVAGVMLGRSAMSAPWVFGSIRHYLDAGELLPEPRLEEQWGHILRHCREASARSGAEGITMQFMRSRLMAYSRGMPEARELRMRFSSIGSLGELEDIAAGHIQRNAFLSTSV
jgi:nifR3 family TIM-barrel protein